MVEEGEGFVVTKVSTKVKNKKMVSMLSRGERMAPGNPLTKILSKCSVCDIQQFCGKFKDNARCFFQIQNIKAQYKKQKSITSGNPLDLLADIQTNIDKLEELMRYNDEKGYKNKKSDLKDLAFLKLQVYEMIYGRKQPLAVAIGKIEAPQMDVKNLMSQLRKKDSINTDSVVDVEFTETEGGEEDGRTKDA